MIPDHPPLPSPEQAATALSSALAAFKETDSSDAEISPQTGATERIRQRWRDLTEAHARKKVSVGISRLLSPQTPSNGAISEAFRKQIHEGMDTLFALAAAAEVGDLKVFRVEAKLGDTTRGQTAHMVAVPGGDGAVAVMNRVEAGNKQNPERKWSIPLGRAEYSSTMEGMIFAITDASAILAISTGQGIQYRRFPQGMLPPHWKVGQPVTAHALLFEASELAPELKALLEPDTVQEEELQLTAEQVAVLGRDAARCSKRWTVVG